MVTHSGEDGGGGIQALEKVFTDYRATMPENRRDFLERYRFVDVALKVVGVGSVGTRCYILVLEGRDENDPLILQVKEATASVMEPYLAPSAHEPGPAGRGRPADHAGHGGRLPRLDAGPGGRDFYFRQLWDMKGSVDTRSSSRRPRLLRRRLRLGARACACRPVTRAIAAYLGTSDRFDGAIADFRGLRGHQRPRPQRIPSRRSMQGGSR